MSQPVTWGPPGADDTESGGRPERADAILHPDGAAMGVDDLFGDRQAETGVLAETLLRPIGVKPLEDFLDCIGPDAGAVVIDGD